MKNANRAIISLALAALLATEGIAAEVPKQFRIWGRKAPEKLSQNPIPGKTGMESLRIPKEMTMKTPETNLSLDENAASRFAEGGMVPFPWHPMKRVYSVTAPLAAEMGKAARAIATPGEYVPLVAAFHALAPLSCVEVTVAPFTDKKGEERIPKTHIDLRRIMDLPVPLREQPTQYQVEPRYLESFDEFDILQVKKGNTERFWITVKIPDECPPGILRSVIRFQARGRKAVTLPLMLRVLPFQLQKPNPNTEMTFSILSGVNDPRYKLFGRDHQNHLALRQLADMAEHGMTTNSYEHNNPHATLRPDNTLALDFDRPGMTCFYSMNDFMYLVMRAGLTGPFAIYNGPYEWGQYMLPGLFKMQRFSDEYNAALRQLTREVEEHRKKMGWPHFVWFVGDEPAHDNLRLKTAENTGRQILSVLPDAEVSNFFNGMHSGIKDWKLMRSGATLNCANFFNNAVLEETRALGYKKHWNYNSVGNVSADWRGDRIAYGILPWKLGSSGVTQYVLRETPLKIKDLEFAIYDQINCGRTDYDYTYPAADGPLPTPHWEAIRQGVYDYYYLHTLRNLIRKAGDTPEAKAAQTEMEAILKAFPDDYATQKRAVYIDAISPDTLDAWRWRIAQQIMKLQKAAQK